MVRCVNSALQNVWSAGFGCFLCLYRCSYVLAAWWLRGALYPKLPRTIAHVYHCLSLPLTLTMCFWQPTHTEELQQQAGVFKRNANELKNKMWWKNMRVSL
jgi:hypothetical protein